MGMDRAPGTEIVRFDSRRVDEEVIGSIAIPVRDHLASAMVTSLLGSDLTFGPVDRAVIQGNLLHLQRNEAVQRMRGDWLFFIDDDMQWNPGQIRQLVATREQFDFDVLGGLCFRRAAPHQPTLYMREHEGNGPYNFLESWEKDVIEVDATGMAFCIIHRRVFEGIARRQGEVFGSWEERMARPSPPSFFRWEGIKGEDILFCELAKEAGFRIWVDTRNEIRHLSEIAVGHRDFLRELAFRPDDVIEARRSINDKMGFPTLTREDAREKLDGMG